MAIRALQLAARSAYICPAALGISVHARRPVRSCYLLPGSCPERPRRRPGSPGPDLAAELQAVLRAGRAEGGPSVVNVYAAQGGGEPQPAFMDDPFFRRFFGSGGRHAARAGAALARLGRDRRPVRPDRDQQPRDRGRERGEGRARRQARVRGRDRAQGRAHRSRGAAHQGRARALPRDRLRQFRRPAGRRRGARASATRSASARP